MANEPMTDERLAEIRSRVDDQVATQVEAEYLLAEVDRLRAREAAAMADYHLYRIRDAHGMSTEWSFVVAQSQREAIATYAARYPFADEATGVPMGSEDVTRAHVQIVEYALDRAYVLPDAWQSEPEDSD